MTTRKPSKAIQLRRRQDTIASVLSADERLLILRALRSHTAIVALTETLAELTEDSKGGATGPKIAIIVELADLMFGKSPPK